MSVNTVTPVASPSARRRRDSRPPVPKAGTLIAVAALLITAGSIIYGTGTLVASKADKDTVHKIQTDVEVIKTRQEMFIKDVRPNLPIGE